LVVAAEEQGSAKATIKSYWEDMPCGSKHADAPEGEVEYFAQVEKARYELEPFIHRFARFDQTKGKRLLEIGVGLGTDFVNFARAGAAVTGVDLTEHSVRLVRRRLELEGLEGEVRQADAENLPFEDGCFDKVYSWGVLMVTPDTPRAVQEGIRVLRPGGELCAMLYNKRSWVSFGLWVRYGVARGKPGRSLDDVIANHMESPGMKAYTADQVRALFGGLQDVRIDRVGTPYDRRVAGPIVDWTGGKLGWFMVVRGRKPTPSHVLSPVS
jgi:SAM-dependent methyltransferase